MHKFVIIAFFHSLLQSHVSGETLLIVKLQVGLHVGAGLQSVITTHSNEQDTEKNQKEPTNKEPESKK